MAPAPRGLRGGARSQDDIGVTRVAGITSATGTRPLLREAAQFAVGGRRGCARCLPLDDQFHALCWLVDPAEWRAAVLARKTARAGPRLRPGIALHALNSV